MGHYTCRTELRACICGHPIHVTIIGHTNPAVDREIKDRESGHCYRCERRWSGGDQDIPDAVWAVQLKTYRPHSWKENEYILSILGPDHKGIAIKKRCEASGFPCGECKWGKECQFSTKLTFRDVSMLSTRWDSC